MKETLTPLHIAKVRCDTEGKRLFFFDGLITQTIINLAEYYANRHEQAHPTHQVEVQIYEKAPETLDLK